MNINFSSIPSPALMPIKLGKSDPIYYDVLIIATYKASNNYKMPHRQLSKKKKFWFSS